VLLLNSHCNHRPDLYLELLGVLRHDGKHVLLRVEDARRPDVILLRHSSIRSEERTLHLELLGVLRHNGEHALLRVEDARRPDVFLLQHSSIRSENSAP